MKNKKNFIMAVALFLSGVMVGITVWWLYRKRKPRKVIKRDIFRRMITSVLFA